MKRILHIAREGKELGAFLEEDVIKNFREDQDLSGSGAFHPHDLVWHEGMKGWHRLGDVMTKWQRAGGIVSTSTGKKEAPPELKLEPAWERRKEIGKVKAFFQTVLDVMFHPTRTFSQMSLRGKLKEPFFFYFIWTTVMLWIQFFGLLSHLWPIIDSTNNHQQNSSRYDFWLVWFLSSLVITLLPGLMITVSSWILHGTVRLLRFSQQPFRAAWKMNCYLSVSPSIVVIGIALLKSLFFMQLDWLTILTSTLIFSFGIFGSCYTFSLFCIALKRVYALSGKRLFVLMLVTTIVTILLTLLFLFLLILILVLTGGFMLPTLHH